MSTPQAITDPTGEGDSGGVPAGGRVQVRSISTVSSFVGLALVVLVAFLC